MTTADTAPRPEVMTGRDASSFLARVGFTVDVSRGNATFVLGIEPRFLPRRLGTIGGVLIPPAGARGVE